MENPKTPKIEQASVEAGPSPGGWVKHVKGLGGEGITGPQVTKGMGWGKRSTERISGGLRAGPSTSEVGLVLLELHHKMVDVDELSPGRQGPQLGLGQHPVEAMIELDQLGQRSLDDTGSISEVGETPHYILTQ